MSNEFTIIGVRDVLRLFALIRHDLSTPEVMGEIGLFLITKIQIRTAEGKDVNGMPFEPYSPGYRLIRAAAGRSASKVNLFWTGSMMSSMTYEVKGDDTVRLFFQNTSDPSGARNPLKAYAQQQHRDFFSISEEERQGAIRIVLERLRQLRRRNRRR